MLKNYFKMALRNLRKNKVSSFINIFGLSTAIGCCLVVFAFVTYGYQLDTFHENAESIFMVENVIIKDEDNQRWGISPMALGPALKNDFEQVEQFARAEFGSGSLRFEDKVFYETFLFVDADFLNMFTFPLKYGDNNALSDKKAVVLSAQTAIKYFGYSNPVGKQVALSFDNKSPQSFIVGGVTQEIPPNASFGFEILIPYQNYLDLQGWQNDEWRRFTRATFIQVTAPNDIDALKPQLEKYIALQNASREDWRIKSFDFVPLSKLSVTSPQIIGDISGGIPPAGLITMGLLGLFLLSLACFNYMNIAVVSAAGRLKEIGMRKVIGGKKAQIVKQFLSENVVLCLITLVLGVALAKLLFVPGFNSIIQTYGIEIPLDLFGNAALWLFLLALLLLTGIGAGAYPAFYISAFKPVNIFRDKLQLGGRNRLTRILLTFQFIFAFITVFGGIVLLQNAEYQRNRDWGYNQAQTIVIPIDGEQYYTAFKNEINRNPDIVAIAGTATHIGRDSNSALAEIEGKKYDVRRFRVGFDYLETMGLRLKTGRFFNQSFGSDPAQSIIVSETFVKNAQFENALGKQVRLDNLPFTIVGVVEDFHHYDFSQQVQAFVFTLEKESNFSYVVAKVKIGATMQTADFLQKTWKRLIPEKPYIGFFQDSVFDSFFRQNEARTRLGAFAAITALILSCMGLFGLVALNIAKRMKEFSIRKVLGASTMELARLLNKDFVVLMSIATIIAMPVGYFLLDALLNAFYQYRITIDYVPFLLTIGCLFATAIFTVSSQIYRVVIADPVEALRSE